jgi:SpoVK/Ycf46/Vps4 family AAA+-type ATPase
MTNISSETTSGAGFGYEDCVGAYYLAALLGEHSVAGVDSRVVKGVSFQQKSNGFPLDDFVVEADANDRCLMSLQAKRKITISAAKTNKDFRDVVVNSWLTLQTKEFSKGIDRVGCVVEYGSDDKLREVARLCDTARSMSSGVDFCEWLEGAQSSSEAKTTAKVFLDLIEEVKGSASCGDLFILLKHFVIIKLRLFDSPRNDEPTAIDRIRSALPTDCEHDAPRLWEYLKRFACDARARSGRIDRGVLVEKTAPHYRLSVARSLQSTIQRLREVAETNVADIGNQIAGVEIARKHLVNRISEASQTHKLTLLHGDPGCGKSAILKHLVAAELVKGSVLFLKAERLTGKSWIEYASRIQLGRGELSVLFPEFRATGSSILFIDGIDRVGTEHRGVILDLLRAIRLPENEHWRCVGTIRDSGLELFKSWLDWRDANALCLVKVGNFTEDECKTIASAVPRLHPVLFGADQVRDIARRPFFANILAKRYASEAPHQHIPFASEAELLIEWWKHGGYCEESRQIPKRRAALLEIASNAVSNYERTVSQAALSATTNDILDDLYRDQIIRRDGHTHYAFTHDVFFEWSLCFTLEALRDDWLSTISQAGEPPALSRTVELLSQVTLSDSFDVWARRLSLVTSSTLRTQWTRAWLFGAFGLDRSTEINLRLEDVLLGGSGDTLRKLFVWLQAEKTLANPEIVNSSNAGAVLLDRAATAELFAWPRDFRLWLRVIEWTLDRSTRIPSVAISSLVQVFQVWQNALFHTKNPTSERIVGICLEWLNLLEEFAERRSPNDNSAGIVVGYRERKEIVHELRYIVMRASASYPDIAAGYLTSVAKSDRIERGEFADVQNLSFLLAQTIAEALRVFAEKALLNPLPKAQIKQQEESNRRQIEAHQKLLEKPREQWTNLERMSSTHIVFSPSIRHDEWHDLCIRDQSFGEFFPASPLREPFGSLFTHATEHALALTRTVVRHALSAWREMFELMSENRRTPIAIRLAFPWGEQDFWGDDRHYEWSRGDNAAYPLSSALMALENWAFSEVKRGRDRDDVIRDVVRENPTIAVLAIAVSICLEFEKVTPVSYALLSCQRLWRLDVRRFVSDSGSRANRIGFTTRKDASHEKAIRESNTLSCRRRELRDLVIPHLLSSRDDCRDRLAKSIQDFPNNLPFAYEEERDDVNLVRELSETAEIWAQLGALENYRIVKNAPAENQFMIVHDNPRVNAPEIQERLAETNASMEVMNLAAWAASVLERRTETDLGAILKAVGTARKYEAQFLASPSKADELGLPIAGAVVNVAAVCVRELVDPQSEEFDWALKILRVADENTPKNLGPWLDDIAPMFDVRDALGAAYGALIRRGASEPAFRERMLTLCASNNYRIALEAIREVFACAAADADLVWAALELSIQISDIDLSWPRLRDEAEKAKAIKQTEAITAAVIEGLKRRGNRSIVSSLNGVLREDDRRRELNRPSDAVNAMQSGSQVASWRWQSVEEVLRTFPVEQFLISDADHTTMHELLSRLLDWTVARLNDKEDDEERSARDRHREFRECSDTLGNLIARACIDDSLKKFQEAYLSKMCVLEGENLTSMLAPIVRVAVMRIHDDMELCANPLQLLELCIDALIAKGAFQKTWRGEARIYDDALVSIVKDSLQVSVEHAGLSARFSNGNWSQIQLMFSVVNKVVHAASWSINVADAFISLCERAGEHYPTTRFSKQALEFLQTSGANDWIGLTLPRRLATLVQHHADRIDTTAESKRELLRVLDYLVDIGDRRSAALQLSPAFKHIRIS